MPNYDPVEVLRDVIKKEIANVHTTLVAKVEAVNGTTIDAKPVINKIINGSNVEFPLFKDVPPIFMYGGGSYDAMPITVGDYCLLMVNEQCIDRWYDGQDNLEPLEDRSFDYSDCFAIVGVKPQSNAITIPTVATIEGDRVSNGDWLIDGDWTHTGDIILNGVSIWDFIQNHTHGGVQTGGGNTATPNPL